MPSELDRAYAAGLLDGEGCITCEGGSNGIGTVSIQVNMTHERPIRWLGERFGGRVNEYQPLNPEHRTVWCWRLRGPEVVSFLEQVQPYLQVKAVQVEIALGMMTLRPGRGIQWTDATKLMYYELRDRLLADKKLDGRMS